MAYRTFVDSTGVEWQVWDIVPQLRERRSGELTERRMSDVEVPINRRREDRRFIEMRRAILRGSFAEGWLCFESDREKRRLSPIPDDWTTCSDEELETYLRQGARATGSYGVFEDLGGDEPLAETG